MAYQSFDEEEAPAKDGMDGGGDGGDEPMQDEGETTLVPTSMLGGEEPKPGDICHFEVVGVHGNDTELKWVPKGEGSERKGMDGASDRMGKMADGGARMRGNSGGMGY